MRGKLVVLKLDGEWQHQGFRVAVEIGPEGHRPTMEQSGHLPPCPELLVKLQQWQTSYRHLGRSNRALQPQAIVYEGSIRQRIGECQRYGQALETCFTEWLQATHFRTIELCLREELNRYEPVRILIRSSDTAIRQLPWHLWSLIDRYPYAEVGFGMMTSERSPAQLRPARRAAKVLAILGHQAGIDIEKDRRVIEAIPEIEPTFLIEENRAVINAHLWQQSWDILFFAGHSETAADTGRIYINPDESLSLNELKYGLRKAVSNGLQLAIFNSCDGLGLANDLDQIHLPNMIVMREPIPDLIAEEFLKAFLASFAAGSSLYFAEREAREKLHGFEGQFPYASWLPVIIQNSTVPPLTWHDLVGNYEAEAFPAEPVSLEPAHLSPSPQSASATDVPPHQRWMTFKINLRTLRTVGLIALLVTTLIVGLRSYGLLQRSELQAYDHLMQLHPKLGPDARVLVVTVDAEDIAYQDVRGFNRKDGWSLSDQALEKLLATIAPFAPQAIGLDIYHPYPYEPALEKRIQAEKGFVAICAMDSPTAPPDNIMPPPGLTEDQLGFSDLINDADYVVRRHITLMSPGKSCNTSQSFSLQLAEQSLAQQGIPTLQTLPNGQRQLGDYPLPRLQFNSGGYQLPLEEAAGYQTLLNYRHATPETISLRDLLEPTPAIDLEMLISDRIILIGVDQPWQDQHHTVISPTQPVLGVTVHAHAVSQLLDAAINHRGLMHWWPEWLEDGWIMVWALLAGLWTCTQTSRWWLGVGITLISFLLFGSCFAFFWGDQWVPLVPPLLAALMTATLTATVTYKTRTRVRRHSP